MPENVQRPVCRETIRTVELLDIPVRVAITHGHLAPVQRVDDTDASYERLLFSLRATLRGPDRVVSNASGFDSILNYAPVHAHLMRMRKVCIESPIEALVDGVIEVVENHLPETCEGRVRLLKLEAWVIRPGLVDGEVRTSISRSYTAETE